MSTSPGAQTRYLRKEASPFADLPSELMVRITDGSGPPAGSWAFGSTCLLGHGLRSRS